MPGPFGEEVMLPASLIPWLIAQPDSVLNASLAHAAQVSASYTMLHEAIARIPRHEEIIRRELKTQLTNITPDIVDEVSASMHDLWGSNATLAKDEDGFFTIDPAESFRTITSRVSNRILVGRPLCRKPDFYNNAATFVADIAAVGYALRMIPAILRPVVAALATLINRYHFWRCSRHLRPLIDQRLKVWANGDDKIRAAMPNDFLTWAIRDAHKHSYALERTPYMLSLRLLTVNFAVIHTSTMTLTSLLTDLASSPPEMRYVERIRQEILAATSARRCFSPASWTRPQLARLELLDSAVRESMRVSGFQGKVLTRMVTAPGGIDVPVSSTPQADAKAARSIHLPHGTVVNLPGYSIHHDAANFEAPHEFRADRFLGTGKMAATADEAFLPWGLGKHACPGRWMAVDLIKMIAAEIVLHYDVELGTAGDARARGGMFGWNASSSSFPSGKLAETKGLERMWMADIGVPNPAARLRLRRRRERE